MDGKVFVKKARGSQGQDKMINDMLVIVVTGNARSE